MNDFRLLEEGFPEIFRKYSRRYIKKYFIGFASCDLYEGDTYYYYGEEVEIFDNLKQGEPMFWVRRK